MLRTLSNKRGGKLGHFNINALTEFHWAAAWWLLVLKWVK